MRKVFVIGVAVLAACTAHRTDDGIDIDPVSDVVGNWTTTLSAVNSSGISGSATVQSRAISSKISVQIMGGMHGSAHPWHVHRGTCSNDQGIVGEADKYKPLTVSHDGMADQDVEIPVPLNEDGSYFVNIHKSASDLKTIVACGELKH